MAISIDVEEVAEASRVEFDLEAAIAKWNFLKSKLDAVKKEEMELRIQICQAMIKGNHNTPLTGKDSVKQDFIEYQVKAEANVTLKADFAELAAMDLSEEEKAIIRMKPEIDKRALNKLPKDSQVYKALREVPAAPTLSIKEY